MSQLMNDYGSAFQPTTKEARGYLARTLVRMYAPSEPTDPSIHFPDLPDTDPLYPYANVAVKMGWMQAAADGTFQPAWTVRRASFDKALILAMGLSEPAQGLANIHEADGTKYAVSSNFPYLQLAAYLGLHYNHRDESMDLQARTRMPRDEVAYSLWRARTLPSWQTSGTSVFENVTLPTLDDSRPGQLARQRMTGYALRQVGYPYIWGGEWNSATRSGYCCGTQPQGGFDCSGFTWWVLKKSEDGYAAASFRDYAGWSLHQRSSSQMAQYAPTKIAFSNLKTGNLMFFSSSGGTTYRDVNHVGIYLGNGWMIHSTDGGPQLQPVSSGWYPDHFVFGRALTP